MLTGELRNQIDGIWNDFWSGGLANPLKVIEQITYLIFIKRLDEMQELEERKATTLGQPIERRIFPEGKDERGEPYANLRWSRFKHFAGPEMFRIVEDHVFPFIRALNGQGTSYARHMRDARLQIPGPALLAKVVDKLDMGDRDTKGDVYEYMLAKIATAGQNGHCDPACGTCGFLVAAGEYLRKHHAALFRDDKLRRHFNEGLFNGFDFDPTMLRIGSMNMALHGVEGANVTYRDSLAEDHAEDAGRYSLVLANPPFAGSLDYEATAKDLQRIVKTRKTELLFLALFLRLLKIGGRAAVIVPSGVLESDGSAHRTIRRLLMEEGRLEGIISLPHWVFKPYASVATAIALFSKTGRSDGVWFYRVENDGFADDAAKTEIAGSELPEVARLWHTKSFIREGGSKKHRFVPYAEIVENDYDLSPSFHLSGHQYPHGVPLRPLSELFEISKGTIPAASANDGSYTFITSSEEPRRFDHWTKEGEAICIPIVSATGHGHASIKTIHYVNGKFAASTITAVLMKAAPVHVPFVYYYLLAHKDELLVPLMRGAANVSLSLERLARLRVPVPSSIKEQKGFVRNLSKGNILTAQVRSKLSQAESEYKQDLEEFRSNF